MIIKFFSTGIGGGAAPVEYLIAVAVLAYDENRNLIRDDNGDPQIVIRDPLPEVLRGNPDQTRDLIDASANKWSYTAGVISFADSDQPNIEEQQEVIDRFEELAFAGMDADQYDCLWVRHIHEGNVELHFCTPRLELTEGKSLNIAPPGHESAFGTLRDQLNKEHRWADPLEPDRAREFKPVKESAERAAARSAIIGALYDQIDGGLITDRTTMIEFFEDAGFEINRRAEKSISVRDPEFSKPFKLEGVLTHENWTADRHAQIAIDRQVGADENRTRRLDAISNEELCERNHGNIRKRAEYNYQRYGHAERTHGADREFETALDTQNVQLLALDIAGDEPERRSSPDRDQSGVELADAKNGDESLWFDQGNRERANVSGLEHDENTGGELHGGRQADHLFGGDEVDDKVPTDRVGTRITWLRGAVDQVIGAIRESHGRFGKTLDQASERNAGIAYRLRGVLEPVTTALTRCVEDVAERVRDLRAGRASLNEQLETITDRRSAITAELEINEHKQSYGLER